MLPDAEAETSRVISTAELLSERFAADNCLFCGGGASMHEARLDRYMDPVVDCVDRWGGVANHSRALPL